MPLPSPTKDTPGHPCNAHSVAPLLVSTSVTSTLPAAPPPPGWMLPERDAVSHCPSTGADVLVPVGRGVEVPVGVDVDVDAAGVDVGDAEGEQPAIVRTSAPAASAAAARREAGRDELIR
ncbi:hypothetical protein LLS1_33440 [Leifsonia sp. LS1]|nr:hypothetical protein LLS1_33440 [Leifsonia sp. LS1]